MCKRLPRDSETESKKLLRPAKSKINMSGRNATSKSGLWPSSQNVSVLANGLPDKIEESPPARASGGPLRPAKVLTNGLPDKTEESPPARASGGPLRRAKVLTNGLLNKMEESHQQERLMVL